MLMCGKERWILAICFYKKPQEKIDLLTVEAQLSHSADTCRVHLQRAF